MDCNQLKSLLGIETAEEGISPSSKTDCNQLKSLLGIETILYTQISSMSLLKDCNQLKSLLGIETKPNNSISELMVILQSAKIPIRD